MRIAGWEARLRRVIEDSHSRAFVWGTSDCACFAADCAIACTGEDPLAHLRGLYDDALSAARLLKAEGYPATIDIFAQRYREISVAQAGRGDIVEIVDGLHDGPHGAVGVAFGPHILAPGETGLARIDLIKCGRRAFRVELP